MKAKEIKGLLGEKECLVVREALRFKCYGCFYRDVCAEIRINEMFTTIGQINQLFKNLKDFAPSGKVFTPKSLRISFAYMALRAEDEDGRPLFDIAEVQKLMGHKNVETLLKNYYDPTIDEAIIRYKNRMNKIRKKKRKK